MSFLFKAKSDCNFVKTTNFKAFFFYFGFEVHLKKNVKANDAPIEFRLIAITGK